MNKRMKFAVVMTSDYTAKLFTGRAGGQGVMIDKINLDSSLPMTHGDHRVLIDNMLSANNVTPMTFDVQKADDSTTILFGEFINFKTPEKKREMKEYLQATRRRRLISESSEAGFSLIEVVVASALIAVLTAAALPYFMAINNSLNEKIESITSIQQEQQAELDYYLENIAN